MMAWGSMSRDIGFLIMDRLPEVVEHIRFGAVCKQWYAHAKDYSHTEWPRRKALPMLLVPPNTITGTKPNLYALSCCGKFYRNLKLPLAFGYRYCGSSYGWLAIQNSDHTVTLEYPFSDRVTNIHLPSLDPDGQALYEFAVHKLILSPDSTPENYTVVVIYGGNYKVATIKSGEESWAYIDYDEKLDIGVIYRDLVFHKGFVYVLHKFHEVVQIDVNARPPKMSRVLLAIDDYATDEPSYLVESSRGELLLVHRHFAEIFDTVSVVDDVEEEYPLKRNLFEPCRTSGFTIYKLEMDNVTGEVCDKLKLANLNGDALFVGDSMSMSFPAKSFLGCEIDTIYFTYDYWDGSFYEPHGPDDVGYYSLAKKVLGKHYTPLEANKYLPPSTWIVPPVPIFRLTL